MNKTIKIVAVLLILAIIVGCVLFVNHFTDGFQQPFSKFYITYGKQTILSASVGNNFKKEYVFKVHYTFGIFQKNVDWDFELGHLVDFAYLIDGVPHMFSQLDFETLFNVRKVDDTLTIDFSKDVVTLLSEYHGVDPEFVSVFRPEKNVDVVELRFISHNGKDTVVLRGTFGKLNEHVLLTPPEVVF